MLPTDSPRLCCIPQIGHVVKVTTTPQFKKVYATENNMAAVLLTNGSAAVCDCGGKIIMALGKCRKLAFTPKGFIATTSIDGKVEYTDLATGHKHDAKPKVKAFGQVEVIETDRMYCSRTKRELRWKPDAGSIQTTFDGKMLFVHDFGSRPQCHQILRENNFIGHRCSVLVAGDKSTYYNLSGILPDGAAIIEDTQGTYYLTSDGARLHKIYFENQTSPEGFYSMMDAYGATVGEEEDDGRNSHEFEITVEDQAGNPAVTKTLKVTINPASVAE